MSGQSDQIFTDFLIDSKFLAGQMKDILDIIDKDPQEQRSLGDFSNISDRIMGAARSFAEHRPPGHAIHLLSDCTSFLKKIAKGMVEIDNTDQFYIICFNVLIETTSVVQLLLENIDAPMEQIRTHIPEGLTNRLLTIWEQFHQTEGDKEMSQSDIDELMKKING